MLAYWFGIELVVISEGVHLRCARSLYWFDDPHWTIIYSDFEANLSPSDGPRAQNSSTRMSKSPNGIGRRAVVERWPTKEEAVNVSKNSRKSNRRQKSHGFTVSAPHSDPRLSYQTWMEQWTRGRRPKIFIEDVAACAWCRGYKEIAFQIEDETCVWFEYYQKKHGYYYGKWYRTLLERLLERGIRMVVLSVIC